MTLTIEDLRTDSKSGFKFVQSANPGADRPRRYWRARKQLGATGQGETYWRGPTRATPEEAAQDALDHMAGMEPQRLSRKRNKVRLQGRRPYAGRPDVLVLADEAFVDLPPEQNPDPVTITMTRTNPERDLMLSKEFQEVVARLPGNAIGEVKAKGDAQSMKSALGAVLIEGYERRETDAPKYIIVGTQPEREIALACAHHGVVVLVP